jgi:WD40 repeat protein
LNSLAFSPDSHYLLTSSGDGAAQQWDVDYHTTVTYLCSRLVRDFTEDERAQFDISDKELTCPTQ